MAKAKAKSADKEKVGSSVAGDSKNTDDTPAAAAPPSTEKKSETAEAPKSLSDQIEEFLFAEIPIAPLVYYRICFGLIMIWEVHHYFESGFIEKYYIKPEFFFKYFCWMWMPGPLPGDMMYLFYYFLGGIYVCFTLGLFYRYTSVIAFLGFFYWFNLDTTQHLNHYYLVVLMSFLNMFLPLNRNTSLDVILRPEIRVSKVPAWTLWILVFEITVPYFFGGIAKINSDWLAGEPMRMRLLQRVPKGHFLTDWWAPYFFSYGGLLYDLFVAPMLMVKKTRYIAVASTAFFHISNYKMFNIGIFPWFMLFSTPLYFPEVTTFIYQAEWLFLQKPVETDKALTTDASGRVWVKRFVGMFVAYNCLMPFRHHLYPGHTDWTEAGHMYAWHMKLRRKTGQAHFTIKYPDGKIEKVNNRDYLSVRQNDRMNKRPASVLQFAHFLCKKGDLVSGGPVEVYVENPVVLNGRREANCVNPELDLCKESLTWTPYKWILPLDVPLWDSNMKVLTQRVAKRDGKVFVGETAIQKKTEGATGETFFKFGKVTAYNRKKNTWTVRLDDGETETFSVKDLAKSHRYVARHEHGYPLSVAPEYSTTSSPPSLEEAGDDGEEEAEL